MESFGISNLKDIFTSSSNTATIQQGVMFTNQQKKQRVKALSKIKKHSFTNVIEGLQGLSDNTQSEISALMELEQLKATYEGLMQQQQANQSALSTMADMYITSNTNKNIYAGKNVLLKSSGALGYVTPKGVYKWYSSWDTINANSGKNGCPVLRNGESSDYVVLDARNADKFNIEGTVLSMNPRIVVGKPMTAGQSCGNENTNVYVSGSVPPPSTYMGCYKDASSRTMTYQTEGNVFDYETCKQRAADLSSQYFALQNYNEKTEKSQCFISNDYNKAISLGTADEFPVTILWNSTNPAQSNCYGMLKNDGNIYGYDSNGNQTINTGTGTAECALVIPSKIAATWGANVSGVAIGNSTSAVQANNVNGKQSFGYTVGQNVKDPAVGVRKAFDLSYQCGDKIKTEHFPRSADGKGVVLDCTDTPLACSTYLILKDDGKMAIYKGVSPGLNDQLIYEWPKYDVSKSVMNPLYPQNLSKTGTNWISANVRLNEIKTYEYVVSDDGKLMFYIGVDGNMYLTTYTLLEGCPKRTVNSSENAYGNSWANALYKLDTLPNSEFNGKIGYVDDAGELREYSGDTVGYADTYKRYPKYDSAAGSYLGSLQNSNPLACKTACNSMDNCAGYVFDNKNKACYTKDNKIFPKSTRTPSTDYDLYVRELKVNNSNSCSKNIVNIDSDMWKGYTQGSPMDKDETCGLGKVLVDPHEKIKETQKQIDDVVVKIKDKLSQLQKDNVKLTTDMLELQSKIGANWNEYDSVKKNIEQRQTAQTTINSMLSDSHLVVLQENYKYTFFSVVAIGALIIAMSVGKNIPR
jgi:hypothetical protein